MTLKLFADTKCWDFQRAYPDEFASYGCGPGGIGDLLVPDTVYGLSIKPACQVHDWDNRHAKQASKKHRKSCDKRFKKNMFIIVDYNTSGWLLRRLRFTRCRTYYHMVRLFGGPAYWDERN